MNHIFLTDFVFWCQANNHEQNKNLLLPMIEQNLEKTEGRHKGKWNCELNTEFFEGTEKYEKYLPLIVNSIYPALDNMLAEMPLIMPKHSKVINIWYNHYLPGQTQEIHSHGSKSTYSGIYILKMDEVNKTMFYSYTAGLTMCTKEVKQLVEAKEGDIVIFPSHLLHYVLPCENERIAIAFNIDCTF